VSTIALHLAAQQRVALEILDRRVTCLRPFSVVWVDSHESRPALIRAQLGGDFHRLIVRSTAYQHLELAAGFANSEKIDELLHDLGGLAEYEEPALVRIELMGGAQKLESPGSGPGAAAGNSIMQELEQTRLCRRDGIANSGKSERLIEDQQYWVLE
jgi:hypothetical protein